MWLWWFSPYMRQIGEPSGQQLWQQQTSGNNELDSKKRTTTSLSHADWQFFKKNVLHISHENGTKVIGYPPACIPYVKQHFQPVICFSSFYRRSTRFVFKVAIISHLQWHLQYDEGEVKSLRWLIIISKVPCHPADLNKRVWSSICMHLYAWAKRLIS